MRILSITLTLTLVATTAYAQDCDRTCADDAQRDAQGCCIAKTCAEGMTRTPATAGHCCWLGQVWDAWRMACSGEPTRCPSGYGLAATGCVKPKTIARKPEKAEKGREKYDQLCREGVERVMAGKKAEARALFEKAVKVDPKRPLAYNKLCAMLKTAQPHKALPYCRNWAKLETNPFKKRMAQLGVGALERRANEKRRQQ